MVKTGVEAHFVDEGQALGFRFLVQCGHFRADIGRRNKMSVFLKAKFGNL